jgi:hypothetical protein
VRCALLCWVSSVHTVKYVRYFLKKERTWQQRAWRLSIVATPTTATTADDDAVGASAAAAVDVSHVRHAQCSDAPCGSDTRISPGVPFQCRSSVRRAATTFQVAEGFVPPMSTPPELPAKTCPMTLLTPPHRGRASGSRGVAVCVTDGARGVS